MTTKEKSEKDGTPIGQVEPDIRYKIEKDSKDYLELWKFFAERGDYYKDKMWTITMWLFALLGGILGYMMQHFMGARINKDGSVDEPVGLLRSLGYV